MADEVYQYPIDEHEELTVPRFNIGVGAEEYTGEVQGSKASKFEEMAALALDRMASVIDYIFQYEAVTPYTIPGYENKIDFMVNLGGLYRAIEIDHEWIHKTAEAQEYDRIRDQILNDVLQQQGIMPIVRIRVTSFTTQEEMYLLIQEAL